MAVAKSARQFKLDLNVQVKMSDLEQNRRNIYKRRLLFANPISLGHLSQFRNDVLTLIVEQTFCHFIPAKLKRKIILAKTLSHAAKKKCKQTAMHVELSKKDLINYHSGPRKNKKKLNNNEKDLQIIIRIRRNRKTSK